MAGLQTITPKQIETVPMPDISGDLMAYLQVLPGVMSPGDRGGQLFIRGGTPAQNLVLLDGIPLIQPFHIVGFFSAFPSEIIRSVDLYAGGFGAEYGGRLSSVLDISSRNGNKQRYEGSASIGTFLTSLSVEGPLVPGKASFIGTIRESLMKDAVPSSLTGNLPFDFGDEFAKLHMNLDESSQLSVTFVNSHDRGLVDETEAIRTDNLEQLAQGGVTTTDEVSWRNTAIGFRLVSMPNFSPIFGELTGSLGRFSNKFGTPGSPERVSNAVIARTATTLAHRIDVNEVRWGAALELVQVDYDLDGTFQELDSDHDAYINFGPFVEFDWRPSGNVRAIPGLRTFLAAGRQVVAKVEPRIRLSWFPSGFATNRELSAAFGLYHQNVAGLRDERDAGDVFTAWTFSRFDRDLPSALHGILGWRDGDRAIGRSWYRRILQDHGRPVSAGLERISPIHHVADTCRWRGVRFGYSSFCRFARGQSFRRLRTAIR